MAVDHHAAGAHCQGMEPLRIRQGRAHRLFKQYVLASFECGCGQLEVRSGGRGDHDGIDVRPIQDIHRIGHQCERAVQICEMTPPILRGISGGHNLGAAHLAEDAHVIRSPVTQPDDANADRSAFAHIASLSAVRSVT